MSKKRFSGLRLILMVPVVVLLAGGLIIGGRALQEPGEVRTLKKQEVAMSDFICVSLTVRLLSTYLC